MVIFSAPQNGRFTRPERAFIVCGQSNSSGSWPLNDAKLSSIRGGSRGTRNEYDDALGPPVPLVVGEGVLGRSGSSGMGTEDHLAKIVASRPTPPTLAAGADDLDAPLIHFSPARTDPEPFTFRHAFEGIQIFGATGSGKTSGSGRTFALSFLKARLNNVHRFGGLVLIAKPEEFDTWAHPKTGYCALTGRQDDIRVIGMNFEHYRAFGLTERGGNPQFGHTFDFMRHELEELRETPGVDVTQNLVSLFLTALDSGRDRKSTNSDPYWQDALRQLLTNAIELCKLSDDTVTLPRLVEVTLAAPQSRGDIRSPSFRKGECWQALVRADGRTDLTDQQRQDFDQTARYWLRDFADLSDRTRSIVVNSFTSKATALLRHPMRSLFCSGQVTVRPRDSHQGRIVFLDLSVKDWGETGRFAQVLYKTVWQRATERRTRSASPNPVFLWADESQYFITPEDSLFQQTARSKKCATVFLTQNLPNYYTMLGDQSGKSATDALVGNFQTKIFHANADPETNHWAERLFGHEWKDARGSGVQTSGASASSSEQWSPAIPSSTFISLRKGSEIPVVEAILFQAGRDWLREEVATLTRAKGTRRPGIRVFFNQNIGN